MMNITQVCLVTSNKHLHMDNLKLGIFMQLAALKQWHEYA